MTSVAVVILNYNGEKLLPQFLPSVVEHSGNAKIIVADNGSTDSSIPFLKEQFSSVQLIELGQNLGFCGGYNAAIEKIDSEIIVLLNSDVEVTGGWLDSPVQLLKSSDSIAAVQPKILSYRNKNQFEYAGAAGGYIDSLGYPFCRGRIFQTVENDEGQYNDQTEIFWATGACLIIKREKFLEVGGLDNDFFAHMEEIDLCWRLNRAGYKIFYDGKSTVYHLGGGTLSMDNPRKVYYNFRNGLALLVKNLPATELVYKVPMRLLLDWVAAANFLMQGLWGNSIAIPKAHFHFIIQLKAILTKRNQGKKYSFKINDKVVLSKVIVLQYFLLGKKLFPEIKNPK